MGVGEALHRPAVLLPHHPAADVPLPLRRIRHDRPAERRKAGVRAYSIASPSWDEELEFFSIKVPDGPLTSKLQLIQPGDTVLLRQKSTGTLVADALTPGNRLFMISTGTGIAPFASLIRDPETYEKFDHIVLTHTCRDQDELTYGAELYDRLAQDPLIGELVAGRVTLYSTTTREVTPQMGRITRLIEDGRFFADLGISPLDPEIDRVMICGSMAMLNDVKQLVESRGFEEGSNLQAGQLRRRARVRRVNL